MEEKEDAGVRRQDDEQQGGSVVPFLALIACESLVAHMDTQMRDERVLSKQESHGEPG